MIEGLEKAAAEHASRTSYLKVDPVLKSLRDEPRYKALLAKMRLDR